MENNWIVAKFGGSSVRDAQAMLRCCQIIENNPKIKVVVISATQNTTNQLETVSKTAQVGDGMGLELVVNEIINKHIYIARELFTSPAVLLELEVLCGELKALGALILKDRLCSPATMDELNSLGERMSSLLFADLLRLRIPKKIVQLLDARKIIKTNSDFQKAEPQIELIAKNCESQILPTINDETLFVTQGFIGSDSEDCTTTLGREGSDYSATLIGEGVSASLVQIWTDVTGIASCDPRLVDEVKFIKTISYDEATALASLGAKVLFPSTLLPTKRKNIPVFVGSSLYPDRGGTLITQEHDCAFSLKAISLLENKDGAFVSFVGTHIDKKNDLKNILLSYLGADCFQFTKVNIHSITFKIDQ